MAKRFYCMGVIFILGLEVVGLVRLRVKEKACFAFLVLFVAAVVGIAEPSFGASQEYYTVQVGSYPAAPAAERNFNSLARVLAEKDRDFLRIEVVKGYQALRIGRFEGYIPAHRLLELIRGRYSSAFVLRAFIKKARLVRIYGGADRFDEAVKAGVVEDGAEDAARVLSGTPALALPAGRRSDIMEEEIGPAESGGDVLSEGVDFPKSNK